MLGGNRSLSSHILFLVRKAHHHKISHSLDPHSGARTVVRLRAPSVRFPPSGQTKSPSVFTLGSFVCCPLGGNRTLDHLLKRELLYRLSYERKYYFKKQNIVLALNQLEPLRLNLKQKYYFKKQNIVLALNQLEPLRLSPACNALRNIRASTSGNKQNKTIF